MKLLTPFFILVAIIPVTLFAQLNDSSTPIKNQGIKFTQNKGQWLSRVQYQAPMGLGTVFLEKNAFTYVQFNPSDIDKLHSHSGESELKKFHNQNVGGHAWRAKFIGANENPSISGLDKQSEYSNYFIGNDQSKWASHVPIFHGVEYQNLYENIDAKIYSSDNNFKYDFILAPFANPALIQIEYEGLDSINIKNGNLILNTTVGQFIENAPYAYQLIDGKKIEVPCNFEQNGRIISFSFPKGYNKTKPLVIDPVLVGATLSGSGDVTNWGHCATYDSDGFIYTAAQSFGVGYPTTLGSFQVFFDGVTDIAISKFSPDATALIYATYIGGSAADQPNNLVTNENNELFILGISSSINYPVTIDAYDPSGPVGGITKDIIITHLNFDGSDIIGSTYIGGSDDDGVISGSSSRGEIIIDDAGNCYIASVTVSNDFPTTPGAYQLAFGGGAGDDGIIFSLNSELSTLRWSTYFGGNEIDRTYGLVLDSDNNLFVTGFTTNEFIPMSGYQMSYQGGVSDAFIIKLVDNGTSIEYSTYWGSTNSDGAGFVDLDRDGNVYIFGENTGGGIEVTPGVYSNPGSYQFISKFDPTLDNLIFSTVIGTGGPDFSPIAFMVDNCGYIYFCGQGALGDLPLTDDALFTEGGFYIAVLTPNALDLHYGTKHSGNDVKGGASKFNPATGTLYQAVSACGDFFVPTPGAFSTTKEAWCDIGVFKIDFEMSMVIADANPLPSAEGCAPFSVDFDNLSTGISYEWDFDDGTPISTDFEPTHIFTDPGVYNVMLIARNPDGCITADTTYIEITVYSDEVPDVSFEYEIDCATGEIVIVYTGDENIPIIFDMGDATTYIEPEFSHIYDENGTYIITLTGGDGECADFGVYTVEIEVGVPPVEISPNNPTCYQFADGSVTIDIIGSTGGEIIEIFDADGNLLNVGGSNTANTLASDWYYYHVDLGNGCVTIDSVQLFDPLPINAQLHVINSLCFGSGTGSVIVDTVINWQGEYDDMVYIWAPDPNNESGIGSDTATNLPTGDYTLTINDGNGCSKVFDFTIEEPPPMKFTEFGMEPAFCRLHEYQSGNGVVYAAANGGIPDYDYLWTYLETGETSTNTTWGGRNPGLYEMVVTDENGCELIRQIFLDSLNPISDFTTHSNQLQTDCFAIVPVDITYVNTSENFANPNDPFADTTFLYNFNSPNGEWIISHDINETFELSYTESGDYEVCLVALNKNGCSDTTCKIIVICDPFIFDAVNIFSPDGDGINDLFTFYNRSQAVRDFHCILVNRWGTIIGEFYGIDQGWDGTDEKGNPVPDGVYFYVYTGVGDTGQEFEGQGTVQKVSK